MEATKIDRKSPIYLVKSNLSDFSQLFGSGANISRKEHLTGHQL